MSVEDTHFRGTQLADGTPADVLVVDGTIAAVGQNLDVPQSVRTVEADDLIVMPGFVDPHVHLREPGREDAETIATGSAAAAAGGFTAVCAMANTSPVADTAELVEFVYDTGQRVGLVHVQPVGAVSKGLHGEDLAELGLMHSSRAGVTMFSDDGKCVADSLLMRRALEYISSFDGVISQHAQDPRLAGGASCCHEGEVSGRLGLPGWPAVAEDVIVARDVQLAKHTGARVHVAHLTSAESVEIVRWAKSRGIRVTAEVTPHHLLLPTESVESYDPVFKVNPPLRPVEDIEVLREGLADGTIDAIGTDHAPHAPHDKDRCFPTAAFGMVGLETAFAIVNTVMVEGGRMSMSDLERVMSTNPAKIAGLRGFGGPVSAGRPAHLTLVDRSTRWVVDKDDTRSKSTNNPFDGIDVTGAVKYTMYQGRTTYNALKEG